MTNDAEVAKKVDRWIFPGYQGGPLMHVIAGKAVAFKEALDPSFVVYSKNVVKNSKAFAKAFMDLGVPVVSGGTDNHLFTIDVFNGLGMTGKDASKVLQKNNITVNKNTIPNDTNGPFVTSGIRLGTAAMTTKGFDEKDFIKLAGLMTAAPKNNKDLNNEVLEMLKR